MRGSKARYVRAAQLAERTGLSARYFMKLAHSGKISWALQPEGPGGSILFDEAGFEAWLEAGRLARHPSPSVATRSRSIRRSPRSPEAGSLEERLRKRMAELKASTRKQRAERRS